MSFLRPRVVLLKASNLFTGEVTRTEALLMSAFSQAYYLTAYFDERAHFSELFILRFSTYIRKARNFLSKLRLSVGCMGTIEFFSELKWNYSICAWILRWICGRSVILSLDFFASRIRRSVMECSALGFSYVRWKPRNERLAKMGSFHQSKQSDSKRYTVEVRWGILIENLTYFFIP